MKLVTDLKKLARASGSIWNGETMFENEEHRVLYELANCAGMIESHLAYDNDNFMTNRYSKDYIDKLGYDVVNTLWEIMKEYFEKNCYIKRDVYTDCEGVSYNSIIDRQED